MKGPSRLRAVLVGISGYGRIHLGLARAAQPLGLDLVAAVVINRDEEPAEVARLEREGCRIYSDYESMLRAERGRAELCLIPTGIAWHERMTVAALESAAGDPRLAAGGRTGGSGAGAARAGRSNSQRAVAEEHHAVIAVQRVRQRRVHAGVRGEADDDEGLDPQVAEEGVEVGAVKAAVEELRTDVVPRLGRNAGAELKLLR